MDPAAIFWDIVFGVLPGIPAYYGARRFFLRKKPVVYRTAPSQLTPVIAFYQQRQLEIEGRVAPAAIEVSKKSDTKNNNAESLLVANYKKWSSNKAEIPFVFESVKVLETLAEMSVLKLTTEELHNLEVLSNQTEELLTNFFATPESIRSMPAVQKALQEQLTEIAESVRNIEIRGAEDFVRNLQVGTEFIRTKFKS